MLRLYWFDFEVGYYGFGFHRVLHMSPISLPMVWQLWFLYLHIFLLRLAAMYLDFTRHFWLQSWKYGYGLSWTTLYTMCTYVQLFVLHCTHVNGQWKMTSIFWQMEDNINILLGKAGLAIHSSSWSWHSSSLVQFTKVR
jgi:hypothetical protein